jgi:hypothetical protein
MAKDNLGLRIPGVYRISCECSKVNIGQTGHSVDTKLKKHQWHIPLEQPDKSNVAQHSVDSGHRIQFNSASILATKTRYMDRIENELCPNNMKREVGICLSKSWKPLICSLNLQKVTPDPLYTIRSTYRKATVSMPVW